MLPLFLFLHLISTHKPFYCNLHSLFKSNNSYHSNILFIDELSGWMHWHVHPDIHGFTLSLNRGWDCMIRVSTCVGEEAMCGWRYVRWVGGSLLWWIQSLWWLKWKKALQCEKQPNKMMKWGIKIPLLNILATVQGFACIQNCVCVFFLISVYSLSIAEIFTYCRWVWNISHMINGGPLYTFLCFFAVLWYRHEKS